jgi:hypothetical protein
MNISYNYNSIVTEKKREILPELFNLDASATGKHPAYD